MLASVCLQLVILQLMLLLQAVASSSDSAMITLLDNTMQTYPAETTSFGYVLSDRSVYQARLMNPPGNDAQLCTFPSHLLNQTDDASRSGKRIALLVSLGGCDTATKVEVALEMHKRISNLFGFVVFYNNDPNNLYGIVNVTGPSNTTFREALNEMSFSAVSTATGEEMMGRIRQHEAISGSASDYLGPESDGWQLQMFLETTDDTDDIHFAGTRSNRNNYGNFFWYRVALFCILLVLPVIRAVYLWWTGGGRIRLQRNDRGSIIGLLYTPPMSHWYSFRYGAPEAEPAADRMTCSQVMVLPEITYKPPPAEGSDNTDATNDSSQGNSSKNPDDELSFSSKEKSDHRMFKIVDRSSLSFNTAHPIERTNSGEELTTTCTTCSICIEDLEPGERLRLLPCGHAFHTDCIMPWLTRRQGCCPLCKASVLGGEDEESTADDEEPYQTAMDTTQVSSVLDVSGVEEEDDGQEEEEPIDIEAPDENVNNSETPNEDAEGRRMPVSLVEGSDDKGGGR